MSAPCGCHPGTYEGGWHEIRSRRCLLEQSRQFRTALGRSEEPSWEEMLALEANGHDAEVRRIINVELPPI